MTSPLPLDLQSAYIQQTWLPTQTYHAHLWATSGVVVKLTAHMLVDALPCHFAFSPEAAKFETCLLPVRRQMGFEFGMSTARGREFQNQSVTRSEADWL